MIWCPSQQTSSTASQAFLHRHTLCSNAERRVLPLLAGCSGLQCLLCPLCAPIIGRYQYMLSTVYSLDCQCIPGSDNLNLSRKYHQLTLRASLKKFSSSFGQRGRMMQAKTGVKHASLYSEHTRQDQLGPKGVESMFENRQGLKLATYFWPAHDPNNTQAVILGVHGHGAHLQNEYLKRQVAGKPKLYEGSWIQAFNRAGFSVCGLDQQGLGFSESKRNCRCYVESFDDYINDVLQLRRSLDSCKIGGFANKPVFLLGASLGGCISVCAIAQQPNLFRGAMLLAPMLSLERISKTGINPYIRPIASLISWLFPTWAIVEVNHNTMYPEIQADWDADPLVFHGKTRARNAAEYLRVTEWIVANMSRFSFPVITFCSENDTMCDPDGSKMLIDRNKGSDATLRMVNQMWHVLVAEDGNEEVRDELIQWMSQRS